MPEIITRLGQVKWNLTPSTTFATTLSQADWVVMTVDSLIDEWDAKFCLSIKGSLVTRLAEYPSELKHAIPWIFDPNYTGLPEPGYADFMDDTLPSDEEISASVAAMVDWSINEEKKAREIAIHEEYFPHDLEAEEADFCRDNAWFDEDDGWDMTGFISKLSEILKAPVAFNVEVGKLEIAFKPAQPIRNPERMIQMIARKMSAWVMENIQE